MNPVRIQKYTRRKYSFTWRRRGAPETFQHTVFANSFLQAVEDSRSQIRYALAGNARLWAIEGYRIVGGKVISFAPVPAPPDDQHVSEITAPVRCRWYVPLLAGSLFGAGVCLASLILQPRYDGPQLRTIPGTPREEAANTGVSTHSDSIVRASRALTERSFPGIVVAEDVVEVRATRNAIFSARSLRAGERVIVGESLGQYNLNLDQAMDEQIELDDSIVTAPATGILITDLPQREVEVNPGTLLCRISPVRNLRVQLLSRASVYDRQVCEMWKSGSFLSFGEVTRNGSSHSGGSHTSLRILDEFTPVRLGMSVEIRCSFRQ